MEEDLEVAFEKALKSVEYMHTIAHKPSRRTYATRVYSPKRERRCELKVISVLIDMHLAEQENESLQQGLFFLEKKCRDNRLKNCYTKAFLDWNNDVMKTQWPASKSLMNSAHESEGSCEKESWEQAVLRLSTPQTRLSRKLLITWESDRVSRLSWPDNAWAIRCVFSDKGYFQVISTN